MTTVSLSPPHPLRLGRPIRGELPAITFNCVCWIPPHLLLVHLLPRSDQEEQLTLDVAKSYRLGIGGADKAAVPAGGWNRAAASGLKIEAHRAEVTEWERRRFKLKYLHFLTSRPPSLAHFSISFPTNFPLDCSLFYPRSTLASPSFHSLLPARRIPRSPRSLLIPSFIHHLCLLSFRLSSVCPLKQPGDPGVCVCVCEQLSQI